MKDARADAFVIAGDKSAGLFIEHDEAGTVGLANLAVGVIDAVAGIEVEETSVQEDGAMRRIVRIDAGLAGFVEQPEDVGV